MFERFRAIFKLNLGGYINELCQRVPSIYIYIYIHPARFSLKRALKCRNL